MAYGIARTIQQKDEMIEILRPYLQLGMSITRACNSAGLPISTITDYIRKDSENGGVVRLKINAWQNLITDRAVYNIAEAIFNGDSKMSMWWLERRDRENFSTRPKVKAIKREELSEEEKENVNNAIELLID